MATRSAGAAGTATASPAVPQVPSLPSVSSSAAAGADAFDAIVQAANPAHPDHAAWVERYGGSLRSVHKSVDGSEAPSTAATAPNSLRRSRSKTATRTGTSMRSRPSLDSAMLRPARQVDHNHAPDHGRGTSEQIPQRHAARQQHASCSRSAAADDASASREGSERTHRRRHKKGKGKGKAAPPPVPPPRTTSHIVHQEQPHDSPMSMQEARLPPLDAATYRDVHSSAPGHQMSSFANFYASAPPSPTTIPNGAAATDALLRGTSSQTSGSPATGTTSPPHSANALFDARHRNEEHMGSINGLAKAPTLTSAAPSSHSTLPARQSSKGSELSNDGSQHPSRSVLAPLPADLSGRRSIDFRLPDDAAAAKARPDTRQQRGGLDAFLSPFRKAVSARRAERQMTESQSDIKPVPILRIAPDPPSVSSGQRQAPTPPPRSPLRARTPIEHVKATGDQDNDAQGASTRAEIANGLSDRALPASQDKRDPFVKQKIAPPDAVPVAERDVPLAARDIEHGEMMATGNRFGAKNGALHHAKRQINSSGPILSHSRTFSLDTEDGEEFHDARSDEGGNGSSADDDVRKSVGPAPVRKRRSRRKSVESVHAARSQVKEATQSAVPLPEGASALVNEVGMKTKRHDSSASEDAVPAPPVSMQARRRYSRGSTGRAEENLQKHRKPVDWKAYNDDLRLEGDSTELGKETEAKLPLPTSHAPGFTRDDPQQAAPSMLEVVDGSLAHSIDSDRTKELPQLPEHASRQVSAPVPAQDLNERQSTMPSRSSRSLAESYRAANGVSMSGREASDPKALPSPPSDESVMKRQVCHQRSFSRINGGRKISGVLARIRRDKTPSYPQLPKSDSLTASASGSLQSCSQTQLPHSPNSSSFIDRSASIGLGIDTLPNPNGKGTPTEPSRPHHEGNWRNRLPSFSSGKATKAVQSNQLGADSTPPHLPPTPQSLGDDGQRRKLLYEAVERSLSDNYVIPAANVPSAASPTIHKTLSPAFLSETKHEADEVGSFIGSDDAEEERLADSKRGTWNSMNGYELPPDKVFERSSPVTPRIDVQPAPPLHQSTDTSDGLSTDAQFASQPMSGPRRFPSADGERLSMTNRRTSRPSPSSKFKTVPNALDLSPSKMSCVDTGSDEYLRSYDDSKASPFINDQPGNSSPAPAFPSTPGSAVASPTVESKRSRNHSMSNTFLGAGASKPRTSFAADRDRSPVMHQAWADLPQSPSPKASAVRKFFGGNKSPLSRSKGRSASSNALMSPSLSSFGNYGSPVFANGPSESYSDQRLEAHAFEQTPSSVSGAMWSPHSGTNVAPTGQAADGRTTPAGAGSGYGLAEAASISSSQPFSSLDHSSPSVHPSTPKARMDGSANGLHNDVSFGSATGPEGSIHSIAMTEAGRTSTPSLSSKSVSASTSHNRLGATTPGAGSTTTAHSAAEWDAFDRMLRDRAKEDAQRLREIAQRTASANNTPNLNVSDKQQ